MDLWQLHIFCKVIEHKSFSKAGKTIHLSQPTVSSHIKDLENHFNCRLIDRLTKEVVPTKAGELLYGHAKKILALRDATESALAEYNGNIRGRLVIGGSTIPGTYLMPQLIADFKNIYPEVIISLVIGDTADIIERILEGHLEMGIVGARAASQKIDQKVILSDEMGLIVPAGHRWAGKNKVSLQQLVTEPFIIRERGSGTLTSLHQSLRNQGYAVEDLKVIAELGSTQAICQGIKNGVGVSILSTLAVAEDIQAGKLSALKVNGLNLKRNFYLTRHKRRSPSPLHKAFVDFLNETLPCP
ncbi:MAG: selenium metabolism-associated LysR family transcriptional regulator [Desulfobacterales bacterium]|jgi:DNA-binding transcriptional LysR family regulator